VDGLPPDPWEAVFSFETDSNIRNLYGGQDELLVITDTEFFRLDENQSIISQHTLAIPDEFRGTRPSLSQFTIVRPVLNGVTSKEEIEFYPVRNPDAKLVIPIDTFEDATRKYSLENTAKFRGAFNQSGDRFCLPVVNILQGYHEFLIFAIEFNPARTEFTSITLEQTIEGVDPSSGDLLPEDFFTIQNFKFMQDHFFAMTEDGVWRISNNGEAKFVFPQWTIDAFLKSDTIFLKGGLNDVDFFFSTDEGLTFSRKNAPSALRYVEVENGIILSQENQGFQWGVATGDFRNVTPLFLNQDFDLTFGNFQSIEGFDGCIYMSVAKQLYVQCGPLVLETE